MIQIPSIQELWSKEPKEYRFWVKTFTICLLIIALSYIATIITAFLNRSFLENQINQISKTGFLKNTPVDASKMFIIEYAALPIFLFGIFIAGFLSWKSSLKNSYHRQNFARLALFPLLICEIKGFFAVFDLTGFIWNSGSFQTNSYEIIQILSSIVLIGVLIFAFKVNGIRRKFFISERYAMMQGYAQPQAQNFNQQAQPGSMNVPPQANNQGQIQTNQGPTIEEQLSSLTISELQTMASKLQICGYEKMTYQDLIATIVRIAKSEETDSKKQ